MEVKQSTDESLETARDPFEEHAKTVLRLAVLPKAHVFFPLKKTCASAFVADTDSLSLRLSLLRDCRRQRFLGTHQGQFLLAGSRIRRLPFGVVFQRALKRLQ